MRRSRKRFLFAKAVQRLQVRPGEVLVVSVPGFLPATKAEVIYKQMQQIFPGCRSIILSEGMKIGVITK